MHHFPPIFLSHNHLMLLKIIFTRTSVPLHYSLPHQLDQTSLTSQQSQTYLMENSVPLVRMKMKFFTINPKRKMMRKKLSLFHQSQSYHHTTYHPLCKILKNPIFKILNTSIAWIVKKSNIQWGLSSKGCVSWKNKMYKMLCCSIMWANGLTTRHNYQTQKR